MWKIIDLYFRESFIRSFLMLSLGLSIILTGELLIELVLSIEELESLKTELGVLESPILEPPLFDRPRVDRPTFENTSSDRPHFNLTTYNEAIVIKSLGLFLFLIGTVCLADAFMFPE